MKGLFSGNPGRRFAWTCCWAAFLTFTSFGQTPPPYDAFANRSFVTGLQVVAFGTNNYATAEPGEPLHAGQAARRSLWWSWLAPYDGVAQLLVTNFSTPRIRSAVYLGNQLTNLSVVATNAASTNRVVEFPVRAGETYQIAVDERNFLGPTTFTLRLNLSTLLLTQPAVEARLPAGRTVRLAVTNTQTDIPLARVDYFVSSNRLGGTTEAPFAFDWTPSVPSRTNLSAVATNTLGGRRESPLVWVTITPPNDNFADALTLPSAALNAILAGSNALASAEAGEPAHAERTATKSLWWSWTPAYSGRASIKIISSAVQARIAVYTGDALSNLVSVSAAFAFGTPVQTVFEAAAGTTYFIALDGSFSGVNGVVTAELALTTLCFVSPLPGTRVLANQPVQLVVTNYESDHPIATLDLLLDTNNTVASGWSPPWELMWTTNEPGQYTFTATGTNSLGEPRVSDTLTLLVSPANDDFANALELPSLSNAVASAECTTAFATREPGEPVHQGSSAEASVWFTWVSPWDGEISFLAEGSLSAPILVVYSGDALTNLVALSTPQWLVARVTKGQRYYIVLASLSQYAGPVRVSVLPPPGNNDFANAIELPSTNGTFSGPNFSANSEPGEPVNGPENSASIWWRWTAPATGDFSINSGASYGMTVQMAAYLGSSVSNLTTVVAPRITSSLSTTGSGMQGGFGFRAQAGVTYYIRFSGGYAEFYQSFGLYGIIAGSYNFVALPDIPANDNFAGRLPLTGSSNSVFADNTLASTEPGEPRPTSCDPTGRSLWWTYTAPAAGLLRVWVTGVSNNFVWALYRGTALDQLQPQGFSCDQPTAFMVQPGDAFVISVDGTFSRVGAFTLETLLSTTGLNDNFANSLHLEGTNVTAHGDTVAATIEPGEPNPGETNTIWFSWAAPVTGRVWFSPGPNVSRTAVVYLGPALNLLTPVRLVSADNGVFCFLAEEGTVYHFQYAGGTGDFILSVQVEPFGPCLNDNFAAAQVVRGQNASDRRPVTGATLELGEPAHRGTTPAKSIWWQWQAPMNGTIGFFCERSLATNVMLAVYRGTAVEALTLVAKSANQVSFAARGGETYHLAAAVMEQSAGDVLLYWQYATVSSASQLVPGNLLREPSWEGTGILDAQYWGMAGEIGGSINAPGGADGVTWPVLGGGAQVWQDFATVPGQNHSVRFAFSGGGAQVRVTWDERELGVATIPADEGTFWHWANFTAYASNTTSRVKFHNLGPMFANVAMDAFSVVPLTAPPQILAQPASASVIAGGTAAFIVGASGSLPLTYSWSFNGAPSMVVSNSLLLLESVTTNQAGLYQVVISNPYGAVTSAPVTLVVEMPTKPVILWQPYGDTVGIGAYYNFSVVAAGTLPLTYQWFKDGHALEGAASRNLTFATVDSTNAGIYSVRVENYAGIVWSLGTRLIVTNAFPGGGQIYFRNEFVSSTGTNVVALVFDIDGVTLLNGSNFLAQLYAGPSLELLRPAGQPSPFRSGFGAGEFYSQIVTLPSVAPGAEAIVQVRAWDARKGSSYEEARAMGGKFGKSELLALTAGGGPFLPADLDGLQSFSLHAGMPQFACGEITFVERQPGGLIVWSHRGESGFRYLIERSARGFEWQPFVVITNLTSTATFTDSANSGASVVFYRSRILD